MYHFFKRIEDIFISLAILVAALPVMIFIMLALKLSGIKLIFSQTRAGLNGKPFKIYKFKTMTDAKDESGNLLADEFRITKIGTFLRKTSLDELPQMLNVLIGDMSIVGPRPLLMEYNDLYSAKHRKRLAVTPGITGYAVVNGRSNIKFSQRFDYDAYYADNASFMLDNLIIIKTILLVFSLSGSPSVPSDSIDDLGFFEKIRKKSQNSENLQK